jgi:DNA polymerase III alpha subunit (gram-positive type)
VKYLPLLIQIKTLLFVDLETTGTDSLRNEILTLSIAACDRWGELECLELKMRPEYDSWEIMAENVHGISRFEAERFMPQIEGAKKLIDFLNKYPNSMLVCHAAMMFNSLFDINFLLQFLNKYFRHNALLSNTIIQTSTIVWFRWLDRCGIESNSAYDLAFLCRKYAIELNHHDATSDRLATQKLFFIALDLAKNVNFEPHALEGFIRCEQNANSESKN